MNKRREMKRRVVKMKRFGKRKPSDPDGLCVISPWYVHRVQFPGGRAYTYGYTEEMEGEEYTVISRYWYLITETVGKVAIKAILN